MKFLNKNTKKSENDASPEKKEEPEQRTVKGGMVLLATILGSSMPFIDYSALNVIQPYLQKDLGADFSQVIWLHTGYILFLSSFLLPGGVLGDIYGRRKIFALGVVVFAGSSMLCGFAGAAREMIFARCLQGFGGALLVPGSLAIINSYFKGNEQVRAIGIWSAFSAITTAIGPLLGGYFTEYLSWRLVFFVNGPIALLVLFCLFRYVPESRNDAARGGLDIVGAMLITLGLGTLVYALIEIPRMKPGESEPYMLLAAGVLIIGLFIFWESRYKFAMAPPSFFANRNFAATNLLTLFLYAGMNGVMFLLGFVLVDVQGYSAPEAGQVFLPFVGMMFLISLFSHRLVALLGRKTLLIIGPLIAGLGFFLFGLPGIGGGFVETYLGPIIVMSLGISLTVAPLTSAVMGSVDPSRSGLASGINNAISRVAGLLAIAVIGIFVQTRFNETLEERLKLADAPAPIRQVIMRERHKLSGMNVQDALLTPNPESGSTRGLWWERFKAVWKVQSAAPYAFLEGFRLAGQICALLALTGAVCIFFIFE